MCVSTLSNRIARRRRWGWNWPKSKRDVVYGHGVGVVVGQRLLGASHFWMIIVAGDEIEYYFAGEDDNWGSLECTGVLERVSLAKVPDVDP